MQSYWQLLISTVELNKIFLSCINLHIIPFGNHIKCLQITWEKIILNKTLQNCLSKPEEKTTPTENPIKSHTGLKKKSAKQSLIIRDPS